MNYNDSKPSMRRCTACGKICYSKKMCETVANKDWKERGIELRVYQCQFCNYFHLTSNINSKKYYKKLDKYDKRKHS